MHYRMDSVSLFTCLDSDDVTPVKLSVLLGMSIFYLLKEPCIIYQRSGEIKIVGNSWLYENPSRAGNTWRRGNENC